MKPARVLGVVSITCGGGWERISTVDHPLKA